MEGELQKEKEENKKLYKITVEQEKQMESLVVHQKKCFEIQEKMNEDVQQSKNYSFSFIFLFF